MIDVRAPGQAALVLEVAATYTRCPGLCIGCDRLEHIVEASSVFYDMAIAESVMGRRGIPTMIAAWQLPAPPAPSSSPRQGDGRPADTSRSAGTAASAADQGRRDYERREDRAT